MPTIDDDLIDRLVRGILINEDVSYIINRFFDNGLDNILEENQEYTINSNLFFNINLYYNNNTLSIYKEDKIDYLSTIGISIIGNKNDLIDVITSEEFGKFLLKGKADLSIRKNNKTYSIDITIPTIYDIKKIISGPYIAIKSFRTKLIIQYSPNLYIIANKLKLVNNGRIYCRIFTKPKKYADESSKMDEVDIKMLKSYNISLKAYLGKENYNVILATYNGIKKLIKKHDYEEYNFYEGLGGKSTAIFSSVKIRNKPELVLINRVYIENQKYIIEALTGNGELRIIEKGKFCHNPLAALYGDNCL